MTRPPGSPQPRGPLFLTDLEISTESIVQTALGRWGAEQTFKGLKETEGIAQGSCGSAPPMSGP
jgi:hypothetical protein